MSIVGSHFVSSIYDLMDDCNLCAWFFWFPVVYILYTWVTVYYNLNKISITNKQKFLVSDSS